MRHEDDDRHPSQLEHEPLTTEAAEMYVKKDSDGGVAAGIKLTGRAARYLLPLAALMGILGGPVWLLLSTDAPWWISAPVLVFALCVFIMLMRRWR